MMPVAGLNTRPSGLEKSCSPVRLDRLTVPGAALDSAPNTYTSQLKVMAVLPAAASLIRRMCPFGLPFWMLAPFLTSLYTRGLALSGGMLPELTARLLLLVSVK